MKRRLASLLLLLCLALSLTACKDESPSADTPDSSSKSDAAMTKEEYQSRVDDLNQAIGTAMSSFSTMSPTDEASFRSGIDSIREMTASFREFAAISNPPEDWKEDHNKMGEGCSQFADSLDGLCNSAEKMLDGEMSAEEYNSTITEYTSGLTQASTLLTEGFEMLEE